MTDTGCFQPDILGNISCSPSCIKGLKNPKLKPCEAPTFEKINNEIIRLTNIKSLTAYLYLRTGDSLDSSDIKFFQNKKFKTLTVFHQNDDTINYILGSSFDISVQETNESIESGGSITIWIILLIIFLILIGLIFLMDLSKFYDTIRR